MKRAAIALAPEAHGRAGWPKWRQRIRCAKVQNRVGLVVWFTFMTAHKLSRTMFWQNVVMRRSITWTIWTCIWTNEWARIHFPSLSCQNYPKIGSQVALKSPIHLVQNPKPSFRPRLSLLKFSTPCRLHEMPCVCMEPQHGHPIEVKPFVWSRSDGKWWKVYEGLPTQRSWIFEGPNLLFFCNILGEGPFFPKKTSNMKNWNNGCSKFLPN